MPIDNFRVQFTRGDKLQNDSYLGRDGELTIDKENGNLILHDGLTVGGEVISEPKKGFVTKSIGKAYHEYRPIVDINNPFGPTVKDGDLVYYDTESNLFEPAIAIDITTIDSDATGVGLLSQNTTGASIADVTNGELYPIHHQHVIRVPRHLQKIMLADISEPNCTIYTHPTIPGKVTNIDPLVSHGINTKVMGYVVDGKLLNARDKSGSIEYTVSEGEDISHTVNPLLMMYETVTVYVPIGVTCEIKRWSLMPFYNTLNLFVGGRLDSRVMVPNIQYLSGGPWYGTYGILLQSSDIYVAGNGEIHHHVAPGTKIYKISNQFINIAAYSNRPCTVRLTGYNLKLYSTIGIVGHSLGGTVAYITITGVQFHLERSSASVSPHYLVVGGSWSHSDYMLTLTTSNYTIVGAFAPVLGQGVYGNFTSGVAGNYNGTVIA